MVDFNTAKNNYEEWLSTLEVNSAVCITNLWNFISEEISDFWVSYDEQHVCITSKVRGILEDGSIVVDGDIFNKSGVLESSYKFQEHIPILCPINDELLKLAWRHRFYEQMNEIDWRKVDDDTISSIIDAINNDIKRKELQMQESMESKHEDENEERSKEKRKGIFKPIIKK